MCFHQNPESGSRDSVCRDSVCRDSVCQESAGKPYRSRSTSLMIVPEPDAIKRV